MYFENDLLDQSSSESESEPNQPSEYVGPFEPPRNNLDFEPSVPFLSNYLNLIFNFCPSFISTLGQDCYLHA